MWACRPQLAWPLGADSLRSCLINTPKQSRLPCAATADNGKEVAVAPDTDMCSARPVALLAALGQ